jgi:hypothetical protein
VAVVALAVASVAGPAWADLTIPDPVGAKRVPGTIEVDWGPFAERVSRRHVVVEGDTLRGLAKHYFDDVERWPEIRDENKNAVGEDDVIKVGAELWIPPKNKFEGVKDESETRHDALAHRYEAFWVESFQRHRLRIAERACLAAEIPEKYRGGGTIWFLRLPEARVEIARLNGQDVAKQSLRELRASLWVDTLLSDKDPSTRVVMQFRLTGRDTGAVTMEKSRQRFDAEGNEVTEEFPVPKRGGGFRTLRDLPPPEDGSSLLWSPLFAVIAAFLGLVIVAGAALARRRAARANA